MVKTPTAKKAPKASKPRAPRPTADKAGRPSPPDRDGDGKPGGSLAGNQTVETAKGTDEHVIALQQIAEDGTATIIIPAFAEGHRGEHPLGVNGRIRKLKIGVQVQVNADELAALEASHIEYETVSPLATVEEAAVEGSSAASTEEPETTEQTETPVTETAGEQTEGGEGGNADTTQGAEQSTEGTDTGNGDGSAA